MSKKQKPDKKDNTRKFLQECYVVFANRKQSASQYLASDYLYDILKHFEIKPEDIVPE